MRRPKTWLITDTHFNHKRLVEMGWRPADFQQRILEQWCRLVHVEDEVIHLGDVIIGQNSTLESILSTLPGRKILVRGNHDHERNAWYCKRGFDFVADGILRKGIWCTHAPQVNLPDGAVLNVHGHLHDSTHHGTPADFPAHCKLLALEHTNYAPVEWNEFCG